jgi:filamentous hemagglutinin
LNIVEKIKHIFRGKDGHVSDTLENRALLIRTARDECNYIGTDMDGSRWYALELDGSNQAWVSIRDGIIQNGGINNPPWMDWPRLGKE